MPLRSRRVVPPEILGQVDDVAALASAEDLQHCVELAAQLGETQADVARTYAVDAATISRLAAASPFRGRGRRPSVK